MFYRAAQLLRPIGLHQTLLVEPRGGGFSILQINPNPGLFETRTLADVACHSVRPIGRVGRPDPRLCLRWQTSLTFYGRQFDELAPRDADMRLRRRIACAPMTVHARHIARNHYMVTGSYYAIFGAILDTGVGLPCVLLERLTHAPTSLPVLLLNLRNCHLGRKFDELLRNMMRATCAGLQLSDA